MSKIVKADEPVSGDVLNANWKQWLAPMGDGPYPRRVWEPWVAGMETKGGGLTLGTNDHSEPFCRVSGYLRNAEQNARRMCAVWNAFIGVPTEEIERLAKERSGWPGYDPKAMWEMDGHPMKDANPSAKGPSNAT